LFSQKLLTNVEQALVAEKKGKEDMDPNYATIVKQDLNKLLATRFIQYVDDATWLSPVSSTQEKWQIDNLYRF